MTCGTVPLALLAGYEIKDIQAMLRNATLAVTADTYTDVFEQAQTADGEAMVAVVPRSCAAGASDPAGPTCLI